MLARRHHFAKASFLDGQLAALEPPAPDEAAIRADITGTPEAIVDALLPAFA